MMSENEIKRYELLRAYTKEKAEINMEGILKDCFKIQEADASGSIRMDIGRWMKRLGFKRYQRHDGTRYYSKERTGSRTIPGTNW